jgi:hypothetical protein
VRPCCCAERSGGLKAVSCAGVWFAEELATGFEGASETFALLSGSYRSPGLDLKGVVDGSPPRPKAWSVLWNAKSLDEVRPGCSGIYAPADGQSRRRPDAVAEDRRREEDEVKREESKCEKFSGGEKAGNSSPSAECWRKRNAGESGIVIFLIRVILAEVVTTIRKRNGRQFLCCDGIG